ncbi:MAG: hypothetical protein Q8P18_09775 [Pseudomonadota bacterium]|nr:hypothetical protein [Pseudomonadota bacterium]
MPSHSSPPSPRGLGLPGLPELLRAGLAWACASVVALAGCDTLGEAEKAGESEPPLEISSASAADLYGLQVGARWTYLRTNDVLRWKEITACEDVLVLDPVTGAQSVVRAYVRENRSETGTTSVHYLIEDDEGVKRVRRDDVDGGALDMFATYAPSGPRLYNGPYPDGFRWEFSQMNGEFNPRIGNESRGYSETAAVDDVLGIESLTVMAGTFTTLSVERQWDANNPHDVVSHYAPGVGEVRERTEWPGLTIQIEELVAYTPGYGSCDGRVPLFDRSCDAPLLTCDSPWGNGVAGCTDPRVDAANCGECGNACESGVCAGGACVTPTCDLACEGTTACCSDAWSWGYEGCTSPARDPWNCGACGVVCEADEICDHGQCGCQPGTAECGGAGVCQDVLDDPENCGECGNACGGDTPTCDKGVCVSNCLSVDLADCGDACVDLDWDSDNCGACGTECGNGTGSTSCADGACVTCAEAGLTECDGDCEDLRWSDGNCGSCNHACGDNQACVDGECTGGDDSCDQSCADGDKICCGGECIDPRTSDNHCGGCEVAECEGGCTEACRDGECTPVDCGGGDD